MDTLFLIAYQLVAMVHSSNWVHHVTLWPLMLIIIIIKYYCHY